MLRADFDRNLKLLQDDLIDLGNLVGQAITQAMDALKNRDLDASRRIVAEDDIIDQKRFELEDQCIDLIATQQPIAIDLRTLVAVLHIAVELERMGDYAEGIAKVTLLMGDEPESTPLFDLPLLAHKASDMLDRSLDALLLRDAGAAPKPPVWMFGKHYASIGRNPSQTPTLSLCRLQQRRTVTRVLCKSSRIASGHLFDVVCDAARLVLAKVTLEVEHPIRELLGHALREHAVLQIRR